MIKKNILLTGGCGYVGSVLALKLIKLNYNVTILDTMWFGNFIKNYNEITFLKKDIRDIKNISLKKYHTIIHLANIANDPSVELNPGISWDINCIGTYQLIEKAIKDKVKHFIFSSSGSVYGLKKEKFVTEDLPAVPISIYNKTKIIAEKLILSYKNDILVHNIRPATVCGLSPRMRFDVSVNLLTLQALKNNQINVMGGNQIRPNIHIQDLTDVFIFFLKKGSRINSGNFNAGFENLSIINLAKKISKMTKASIIKTTSNDPRSYRQDSSKLIKLGFKNKYNVEYAINEIIDFYNKNKKIDLPSSYNVKWMKKLKI